MRAFPRKSWLPWLTAATLLLTPAAWPQLATTAPASSARNLPSLGDGADMTLGDERRLGDSIVRTLYRDPDYLDDPALMAYLDSIWQPLLASAKARGDVPPMKASATRGGCCSTATRRSTRFHCRAATCASTWG